MNTQSNFTIPSRIMIAPALRLLSRVYKSSLHVISEYLDNAHDAGANEIWIVLEEDGITITDNGQGMVPDILAEDLEVLERYVRGELEDMESIKQLISPPSRSSLRWMVEFAALSSKIQDGDTRGAFGIGAIAFRMIADAAMWITKPNLELASAFWNTEIKSVPTYALKPPTNNQLSKQNIQNEIYQCDPLLNPFGKPLTSGTSVRITELKDGVIEGLRPSVVADYMSHRFGADIGAKKYKIIIIDRISAKGKRSRAGVKIEVQSPEFKGIKIVDTEGRLKGGLHPFKVELWYDPSAKNNTPQIVRRGSAVGPITAIADLMRGPWNSGQLSGFVAWPDVSESEASWDTSKQFPLPSSILTQWLKSLSFIEKEVYEQIRAIETKTENDENQKRMNSVANAVAQAMEESSVFQRLIAAPPRLTKKVKVKTKKTVGSDNSVSRVRVIDEYGRPLRGISVILHKNGRLQSEMETGVSGTVNMGVLEIARYSVSLTLKNPTWVSDQNKLIFEISPNQLSVNLKFKVTTGSEPPERDSKIPRIILWPRSMSSDTKLYSIDRIKHGIIEINTNQSSYRLALLSGDVNEQILFETLFASMAIVEHMFPNESPDYVFEHALTLQAEALSRVKIPRKTRKTKAMST